jgi:hypothetical protein
MWFRLIPPAKIAWSEDVQHQSYCKPANCHQKNAVGTSLVAMQTTWHCKSTIRPCQYTYNKKVVCSIIHGRVWAYRFDRRFLHLPKFICTLHINTILYFISGLGKLFCNIFIPNILTSGLLNFNSAVYTSTIMSHKKGYLLHTVNLTVKL